ncbi:MAG: type II toxin-antitoxin system VapC family toxin [Patescibacteria group bacterium]
MANNKFLIDTNIFIGFYLTNDTNHEISRSILKEAARSEVMIPYCVIQEVSTLLTYRLGKEKANEFLMDISCTDNISLISTDLNNEIEFFKKLNKKISFADSSQIYLAKKYNAVLLTLDQELLKIYKQH